MELRDELSTLLTSSSLLVVGVLLSAVLKLVEQAIIARRFGPRVYGEVSIGLAILSIGVTVSLLGFDHGIPRYISRFEDSADVRGTWITGLLYTLVFGGGLAAVLFVSADVITAALFEGSGSVRLVRLFVLCIPLIGGMTVGLSAIRGFENTVYKIYAKDILYPLSRVLLLVAFIGVGLGAVSAGYAYVCAAALTLFMTHLLFSRLLTLRGSVRVHGRELLSFSIPLVVSSLLAVLLVKTDTVMLGYFRSSAEVGLYGTAYPLANSLLLVLSSFGYLYLPLTSRLDADGDRAAINRVYSLTTKWVYILTFPAFLMFVVFPGDVLAIVFGPEFREGGIALTLLAIGFFTSAAAGRNRETLSAMGYTKHILLIDALTFGLNVGANLMLIPQYGIVGASVASMCSFAVRNVAMNVLLYVKFDISPITPHSLRAFVLLPVLTIPPLVAVEPHFNITVLTLPLFLVGMGLLVVVLVSITGCLQVEDSIPLELVEDALGKRIPFLWRFIPSQGETL